MPPLYPECSDKEENDPDVPSLPSTDNGHEENYPDLTTLHPVDSSEEGKTSDDVSVTYCGTMLDLDSQARKLFEGLGWFPAEVVDDLLDGENTQMYTIRFTDGKEETWSAHDVTVNAESDSIAIVDVGFQFIQLFSGGGHFSGNVIEILRSGKRRCRFCDGDECRYTLKNFNAFQASRLFLYI